MDTKICPCCPNHCSIDHLSCDRGRAHFNQISNEPNSLKEQVIMDLRKCGHLLHHNKELNPDEFLAVFRSEELEELHKLLSKIPDNL